MRTPSTSKPQHLNGDAEPVEASVGSEGGQGLGEIDTILAELAQRDIQAAASAVDTIDVEHRFLADFTAICNTEVRPAMTAVLQRLQHGGGGGLIEEHPGGEPRIPTPRLTLWMSLQGDVVGSPRPDRHAYLQLDASVVARQIAVSEGDMWRGRAGRSGRVGTWQLREVTYDRIIQELVAILRRCSGMTANGRPSVAEPSPN
jgi:hypothetical protein